MIVAAHQPNFLPWLGFFDRMRRADLFVFVDHVQFERQNYQNRALIKTAEGARWITVPVHQRSQKEKIVEKTIDNQGTGKHRWGRKAFLTMQYSYQAAPYYAHYAPRLKELLDGHWDRLADLNLALLEFTRSSLGIETPVLRSSDLPVAGAKSDMVLNLCKAVGADTYLAGMGGSRHYLDVEAFERAGVKVQFQDFQHPKYPQIPGGGFVEGLSAVDLLFNCGPHGRKLLEGQAQEQARFA
jgi:hypothetical protein